jgi:hypothetical protein
MIIKNVKDVNSFFKAVDRCKGRVELLTEEGDRLNLKSKLAQYVSLTGIFSDPSITQCEILVSDTEDISILIEHLIRD